MILGRLNGLLFLATVPHRAAMSSASRNVEIATFAAGCFWGVENMFQKHYPPAQNKGVLKTRVGFTGGNPSAKNPDYRAVSNGVYDHAETVKVQFDPDIVSYEELVGFFYRIHDPTTLNRQGADIGAPCRSAIFTQSPEQEAIAKRVTEEVQAKHFTPKGKKIVTQIEPVSEWWDAEEQHQMYLNKNPGGYRCRTHFLHW